METLITRKKFEIIKSEPPYEPTQKALPDFVTIAELTSVSEKALSSHHLYLTSEAMSEITSHTGWGKKTHHNCIEQGGILLGEAFRDRDRDITYGIVYAAIPALSARGSSVHLEMPHDTWREMLDSAERLLEDSPQKELHIIGWYHTHPNGLAVFMSGTDQETQRRMFAHDWQFAIVLNPQKREWRTFFGSEAEECNGFVLVEERSISETELIVSEGLELASTQETQTVTIEAPVTEPESSSTESITKTAVRRRRKLWFDSPGNLLKICAILLLVSLVLQLILIGLVSATALRVSLR